VRGLPPLRTERIDAELLKRLTPRTGATDARRTTTVDGACAYCGDRRLDEDHLIPRNRASGGLHAWGNAVPSCKSCNSAKSSKLCTAHLAQLQATGAIDADEMALRATAIRAMVEHFDYKPQVNELLPVIEDLYRHADVQARSLIRFAVAALKPYLDEIAEKASPGPGSDGGVSSDKGD
jgi:hypothetical protein